MLYGLIPFEAHRPFAKQRINFCLNSSDHFPLHNPLSLCPRLSLTSPVDPGFNRLTSIVPCDRGCTPYLLIFSPSIMGYIVRFLYLRWETNGSSNTFCWGLKGSCWLKHQVTGLIYLTSIGSVVHSHPISVYILQQDSFWAFSEYFGFLH